MISSGGLLDGWEDRWIIHRIKWLLTEKRKALIKYYLGTQIGHSWHHEELDHYEKALASPFCMRDSLVHLDPMINISASQVDSGGLKRKMRTLIEAESPGFFSVWPNRFLGYE